MTSQSNENFPQISPVVIDHSHWETDTRSRKHSFTISLSGKNEKEGAGLELTAYKKKYSLLEIHAHQNGEHYISSGGDGQDETEVFNCLGDIEFHFVFIPKATYDELPSDPSLKWARVYDFKRNEIDFKAKVLTIFFEVAKVDKSIIPKDGKKEEKRKQEIAQGSRLLRDLVSSLKSFVETPQQTTSISSWDYLFDAFGERDEKQGTTAVVYENGSLTTPPYTPHVSFILLQKKLYIEKDMLEEARKTLSNKYRSALEMDRVSVQVFKTPSKRIQKMPRTMNIQHVYVKFER